MTPEQASQKLDGKVHSEIPMKPVKRQRKVKSFEAKNTHGEILHQEFINVVESPKELPETFNKKYGWDMPIDKPKTDFPLMLKIVLYISILALLTLFYFYTVDHSLQSGYATGFQAGLDYQKGK